MKNCVLVAAINIGTIITLAIILISFISWIVSKVNEKAQKAQRPMANANPPRGRDDRFQQEIDRFLEQVGGRPAPARPAPRDDFLIEVVPEEELLQRQREERRRQKLSQIEDRHVETSHLGEGVRTHVDTSLQDSLTGKVRTDVGERIAMSVEADFGESKTMLQPPAVTAASVKPGDIVQMLRDRNGVRKAIIINEILARRPWR